MERGCQELFLIFGQFESYGTTRKIKTVNSTNGVEVVPVLSCVTLRKKKKITTIVGLFTI